MPRATLPTTLLTLALCATTTALAGDIVVTGDRPDPCEADPWCTPGTAGDITPRRFERPTY